MDMFSDDGEPLRSAKVCVIGAGMAGLAAARELRREGHAVTVLEQGPDVGGQWRYDPTTDGEDPLGASTAPVRVHSSIYNSVRLVIPREIMGFSDFEFLPRRDPRRFPGHREVYLYLRAFCDAVGLTDVVRLNTRVLRVAMAPATRRWAVRSVVVGAEDDETEEVFDAVVVATGHYSQPRLPRIQGMEEWKRKQLHSHSYRLPAPFRGDVVVLVGCGISGQDIALDLCGGGGAKEVHLAAKGAATPSVSKMLARHAGQLRLRPPVERLCADGRVAFADGSSVVADAVIYCTGYAYSYPFLDTGGAVAVDDNRVGPLFEHTFPPSLAPGLSFVGIPTKVVIPWYFEAQGRWIAQVLSGRRALPPEEEMLRAVEEYYRDREIAGVPQRYTHGIDSEKIFELGEKYCDMARIDDWKVELMLSSFKAMDDDMETFRDRHDDGDDIGKRAQRWRGLFAQAADDVDAIKGGCQYALN